jgi:hypothetical protein
MNPPQAQRRGIVHGVESSTLADVLERILDKGLVIAGDIKIKLVDIELLTIQIRLLVCSVDKAKEMGIDWWSENSYLNPNKIARKLGDDDLESRLERIEKRLLTESSSSAIPEQIEPVGVEIDGKS